MAVMAVAPVVVVVVVVVDGGWWLVVGGGKLSICTNMHEQWNSGFFVLFFVFVFHM